jgi:hypothetical protein
VATTVVATTNGLRRRVITWFAVRRVYRGRHRGRALAYHGKRNVLAPSLHCVRSTNERDMNMITISTLDLANVTGGAAGNTGITGGIHGINNKVPPQVFITPKSAVTGKTGITGGIHGINNKVPSTVFGNTGITGGIHGINNKVPGLR